MREQNYTAIILKKQAYKEADEIITFYTLEAGKIRGLAKSVKSPKSKLQQKLQGLYLVNTSLAGNKMSKVTAAEAVEVFSGLRENLEALKRAFYAAELVLKFTPDEEKNERLFNLLKDFLTFLNKSSDEKLFDLALAKFKLGILETLGLGFSHSFEGKRITPQAQEALKQIEAVEFGNLSETSNISSVTDLNRFLSEFIEYQLERRVKSEKYLNQGNMV
jgi:DNA repair protein RecO (recombination protein O)